MTSPTRLDRRLLEAVANLAPGEVVSYADVAARAGRPGAARAAGRVLANCQGSVPWWRVVYSDGRLPDCNRKVQAKRLKAEGVQLKSGRVVLAPRGRFER